jgi:hypothetical protein
VKGRPLLDAAIRKGAAVFERLGLEGEALLVQGDALLVLNFLLDVLMSPMVSGGSTSSVMALPVVFLTKIDMLSCFSRCCTRSSFGFGVCRA